jgi:hypothetical protein
MPDQPEIRRVKLSNLTAGPIRHEALTDKQLERARLIYACLGPFIGTPFEQFELNFLRDMNPDKEIHIWSCIAVAHQKFLKRKPGVSEDEARLAFTGLLLNSMGATKPDDMPAPLWKSLERIYDGE